MKYCKVWYKLFKRHFSIDPSCCTRNQIVKLCCGFPDISSNTYLHLILKYSIIFFLNSKLSRPRYQDIVTMSNLTEEMKKKDC